MSRFPVHICGQFGTPLYDPGTEEYYYLQFTSIVNLVVGLRLLRCCRNCCNFAGPCGQIMTVSEPFSRFAIRSVQCYFLKIYLWNTLVLTVCCFQQFLPMKQCMYIGVRPSVCGDSRCENVNSHWWFVLCWLHKPYWYCCWCPETETSSLYWAHVSRFHLKMETESSSETLCLNKRLGTV
jgi:hypothetical protein